MPAAERTSDSMRKTLKLLPPTLVPALTVPALTVLGLTVLGLTTLAAPAAAQTTMSVQVETLAFNGRQSGTTLAGEGAEPIGAAECGGMAAEGVRLRLSNFTLPGSGSRVVDIWRGATGAACQTPTNRMATTTTDPACRHVDGITITTSPADIEIAAATLFGDACEGSTEQTFRFWFLLSDSEQNRTDTMLPFGALDATVDLAPPAAPTDVVTTPGDANIQVSWTNPSGATLLRGAAVYVDTAGCADGTPSSSVLMAGVAPPPRGARRIEREGQAITSAQLSGAELGLELGEFAAVAVVLIDRAHNESVLSEVACVQRVQVSGFWDAYCAERGMDVATCSDSFGCAVTSPGARTGGAAALWIAVFAAVGVVMRRARRAR